MTATGSLPSHQPNMRVERDEHVTLDVLNRR